MALPPATAIQDSAIWQGLYHDNGAHFNPPIIWFHMRRAPRYVSDSWNELSAFKVVEGLANFPGNIVTNTKEPNPKS
jgi:hypothetical protein